MFPSVWESTGGMNAIHPKRIPSFGVLTIAVVGRAVWHTSAKAPAGVPPGWDLATAKVAHWIIRIIFTIINLFCEPSCPVHEGIQEETRHLKRRTTRVIFYWFALTFRLTAKNDPKRARKIPQKYKRATAGVRESIYTWLMLWGV